MREFVSVPLDEARGLLPADRAICLMVGNEAHGLAERMIDDADLTVSIPMIGEIESLNAAIAGAICMYELMSARRPPGASRRE